MLVSKNGARRVVELYGDAGTAGCLIKAAGVGIFESALHIGDKRTPLGDDGRQAVCPLVWEIFFLQGVKFCFEPILGLFLADSVATLLIPPVLIFLPSFLFRLPVFLFLPLFNFPNLSFCPGPLSDIQFFFYFFSSSPCATTKCLLFFKSDFLKNYFILYTFQFFSPQYISLRQSRQAEK